MLAGCVSVFRTVLSSTTAKTASNPQVFRVPAVDRIKFSYYWYATLIWSPSHGAVTVMVNAFATKSYVALFYIT